MAYKSLKEFIEILEQKGELKRIQAAVSPNLEITEIYDRVVKNQGPALVFENNGTNFPLAINLYGSEKRLLLSLGIESFDEIEQELSILMDTLLSSKTGKIKKLQRLMKLNNIFPKKLAKKGKCQELEMQRVDLSLLPVLKTWPYDGGKFITLPCVHTIDPETGIPNIGMYRMQVIDNQTTAMHWHMHKDSAAHFDKYKKRKERMPITVTLGGDPVYTYAATSPLPENISEYMLAGFLRKKKTRLVKSLTNDIYIPEDVDFVLEGYIDPQEDLFLEGPFGDHTGFYSLADYYPKFHITKITHRKQAIFPATAVGIPPQEDAFLGMATEKIFLTPLKLAMLPEVIDMHLPTEGAFHNLVLIKIKKQYPGHAQKIMHALWGNGQMMFSKIIAVFDEETDIRDYPALLSKFAAGFSPEKLYFSYGPLDILDHSSDKYALGSKIGIDLCDFKVEEENLNLARDFEDIDFAFAKQKRILEKHILLVAVDDRFEINSITDKKLKEVAESGVKIIIFLDDYVDLLRLQDVAWQIFGNIDPKRDCRMQHSGILLLNARSKNRETTEFSRDWPNALIMDEKTIQKVDNIWKTLQIGDFIPSPSLVYRNYVKNKGAIKKK